MGCTVYEDMKVRSYYNAEDIMKLLDVSRSKAYSMIRSMRAELLETEQISACYPSGRIPKKYFNERCLIE